MDDGAYLKTLYESVEHTKVEAEAADTEPTTATLTFSQYVDEVLQYGVYPEARRIEYPAHGLAGETAEIAEHLESQLCQAVNYLRMVRHAGATAEMVKKMIRDDGGILSEARRGKMLKEMGDVLWYLAALAHDCGSSLEEVARMNREKLAARNAKGLIHGEGSER